MPSRFWRASGNALLPSKNVLGPAGGGTVWTAATDWTLTGSNLIATRSGSSLGDAFVNASAAKTSGSFSVTIGALGTGGLNGFGLQDGSETGVPGLTSHSIAYYADGRIFYNGSQVDTVATAIAGDVIQCVYSGGTVLFKKNGTTLNSGGTPTTITTFTTAYPYMYNSGSNTGMAGTADFSGW